MNAIYSASPKHDGRRYQDVPRRQWQEHHWRAYVNDAKGMLQVCAEHPTVFNAEEWATILATRRNEMALAGFEPE